MFSRGSFSIDRLIFRCRGQRRAYDFPNVFDTLAVHEGRDSVDDVKRRLWVQECGRAHLYG